MTKRVSFLLLVIWLIVIFVFSNMNGTTSYALSQNILIDISNDLIANRPAFDLMHLLLRKAAHVFEYFVLSVLAYNYLRFYIHNNKKLYLTVFLFVVVCSSLDELHQFFIQERLGKPIDVLIDSMGVIIFLIFIIIYKYVASRKSN